MRTNDKMKSRPVRHKRLQKIAPAPRAATAVGVARRFCQGDPIDRSVMCDITGGSEELERELFRQFRKVNDEDAALLRSSAVDGDVGLLIHSSHRMKGAARALGARQLALACERVEDAVREAGLHAVGELMATLESELHRVNVFLDRLETRPTETTDNAASAAQYPGDGA